MPESTILLIDDEVSLRYSIERALADDSIRVLSVEKGREGVARVRSSVPDLVLLDVRLPDMSGLEVLAEIRDIDQKIPVVIITAFGTTDSAIEATKRGAFEYLLKPFDLNQLRDVVHRALEVGKLANRPTAMITDDATLRNGDVIIGRSSIMQDVFKAIGRVAGSEVNVLLLGESGVGKELVARAIYQHSRRSQDIFLAINCAAIPETLLESELFGHEKGAFTGAERQRIGRFEQASGGTIFLDEIGDMDRALQAKILRVLQDQRFERVGGQETIQTDVRLIAATNQNLPELVTAGEFRQDLFYRLNTYTIAIPPLRSRGDDLTLLVDYFIHLHAEKLGRPVAQAVPETMGLLRSYLWPGNVRELESVIKTCLVNSTSNVLTPECLPCSVFELANTNHSALHPHGVIPIASLVEELIARGDNHIYRQVQFACDRFVINEVLRAVDGNQVEAARRLGISRTTLRAKLDSLAGLDRTQAKPDSERVDQ
jgi:two-component system nitrogen regulation response regulator GlnG